MTGLLIIKQDPWALGWTILDARILISCRQGTEHVDINSVTKLHVIPSSRAVPSLAPIVMIGQACLKVGPECNTARDHFIFVLALQHPPQACP